MSISDDRVKLPINANAIVHGPLRFNQVGQADSSSFARDIMQNVTAEAAFYNSKKLEEVVHEMGLKIKQHEENIKFLKSQNNGLDNSILRYARDGAISLDGGMIKDPLEHTTAPGGEEPTSRSEIDLKFPKSFGRSNLPQNYFKIERQIKEMKWKKERNVEDMQREQALLDHARFNFDIKKQEYLKFLAQSSCYATQHSFRQEGSV